MKYDHERRDNHAVRAIKFPVTMVPVPPATASQTEVKFAVKVILYLFSPVRVIGGIPGRAQFSDN